MRGRSFKEQYRRAPPRAGTPPRPVVEPLSPLLRPEELPPAHATAGDSEIAHKSGNGTTEHVQHVSAPLPSDGRRVVRGSRSVAFEQPLRSAPLPSANPQYSPALGSPIDALANAAVSLHPSPVFKEAPRRSSYAPVSPATAAPFQHPLSERRAHHSYPDETLFTYDERPSKRARSEFFPSPHNAHYASRPATSHNPGWSYNVEQMVDHGTRMYQDNGTHGHSQGDDSSKRLSDAQLLLDFSHHAVSASRAVPPPTATAKRWSGSHHKAPTQQLTSPFLGPPYAEAPSAELPYRPDEHAYSAYPEPRPNGLQDKTGTAATAQTHTPPEDAYSNEIPHTSADVDEVDNEQKAKRHHGWPKGKPRGARGGPVTSKKKKPISKAKITASTITPRVPDQLQSPQSLPADGNDVAPPMEAAQVLVREPLRELASHVRRHSLSNLLPPPQQENPQHQDVSRTRSVPPDNSMVITPSTGNSDAQENNFAEPITVCAGCNSTDSETRIGDGEQWINCDGCKGWFHYVCAGFHTERDVRDVDKFYCEACSLTHGNTTKVRKSARAHTAVDYAGLNEGILKTSDDNPEHHYIQAFKNRDLVFAEETFARLPPELLTAEYLEKTNGFKEPIVIPAALNPRPAPITAQSENTVLHSSANGKLSEPEDENYAYELVSDDGQDKLDMVIPHGLTVRRVAELYGPQEKVDVIDVKSQEGEDKRWNMAKWADYYEQVGEKPVRNVISLEVSYSKLGRLIRRPKAVREMDLQDSIWPEDDKTTPPKVQFYCLMSVADCYTDFHIDFGGSSVYYHIVKGKKTFFFIPPTKQNLKKYEDWCLSPTMNHEFLGQQVKECYRVDLSEGDTMLIPSGWIHSVWTPEDSLVIGGNFLTRIHYGMQIRVAEIEKNTKVAPKFRYPFFQKVMWLTLLKYIEEDPVPTSVLQLLQNGGQFHRTIPIFCETNKFGHNSDLGPENYNARYYSKGELEGFPDLVSYIWRTVLISQGRIEGITITTRNAVTRSIPKNRGDPMVNARRFAMWVAWKRGNETIPQWAYSDATLPETIDPQQAKEAEKDPLKQALTMVRERPPRRSRSTGPSVPNSSEVHNQHVPLLPAVPITQTALDAARHMSTPKTSQLGPKRIACDACRRRRIRCKHKDELMESSKQLGGAAAAIPNGQFSVPSGLFSTPSGPIKRRESEDASALALLHSTVIPNTPVTMNGGLLQGEASADSHANKSGRVKACADCRKSKRRCVHDENGNIDPVKASETPVPRGSASKKRRISEGDAEANKKMKKENGAEHARTDSQRWLHRLSQPFPGPLAPPSFGPVDDPFLQNGGEVSAPIDPDMVEYSASLGEGNRNSPFTVTAPNSLSTSEAVITSIENHAGEVMDGVHDHSGDNASANDVSMDNIDDSVHASQALNGIPVGPSSPLSDLVSPTQPDIAQTVASTPPAQRSPGVGSSNQKPSQTPRPNNRMSGTPQSGGTGKGRRDSKGSIRPEQRQTQSSPQEPGVDMASLKLAMQLQMEEHGLRRRSK